MKISVIIPTYNRVDYLPRTINSLLQQTLPAREIIVVDDGSQDATRERIEADYKDTVRYIYRENGGLSAARNTGGQQVTGEAVLFLDSDDLLAPTALARLSAELQSVPNAALAFCRARYINAADHAIAIPNTALEDAIPEGEAWQKLLPSNCIRSAGGVLIRRDALETAGEWDETLRASEDWEMWLRIAESGRAFLRVPEPLLLYRVHGDNMSGNRVLMFETRLKVYRKHLARHAPGSERHQRVQAQYDLWKDRSPEQAEPPSERPAPILLSAGAEGVVYGEESQQRHRFLRQWIERTGVAALYRKTPLQWRLRLRGLFGVDPDA